MSNPDDLDLDADAGAPRRTFAIISHPDAGKTTLTEKFLLYAGAVREAGSVKASGGRRSATSDWMELERKRGISISSTVLQFPYRGHVINLLDTPGHRDFSEDTYRVLAAVDAVVMVLDAAKGVEERTLKLFQVCRARELPVITFINKFDRPAMEPLELLDEIETKIGLRPTPATWPVGDPGDFRGVIDRSSGRLVRFTRTARGAAIAPEELLDPAMAASSAGPAWRRALDECALLDEIGSDVDQKSFLAGESTPTYFGSAITNFGVRMLLDAIIDVAPGPMPRADVAGHPVPLDQELSALVFKVQANMDPSHRDRIAFARVCSGRFERGMVVTCDRTGRPLRTNYASSVFGAERTTIEEAFPGDVIGLVNATGIQLGDTLYADTQVTFPGIPRFEPELFATARPLDTGRTKQFRKGLEQLDEEGVVQVLRDPEVREAPPVLAAVGALQFDVFAHRLEFEFGAPTEISFTAHKAIRLTDAPTAASLRGMGGVRVLARGDGRLVALFESVYRLQRLQGEHPEFMLDSIIV